MHVGTVEEIPVHGFVAGHSRERSAPDPPVQLQEGDGIRGGRPPRDPIARGKEGRRIRAPSRPLAVRQPEEGNHADTAGQRLRHTTHEVELLGAGQPKRSRLTSAVYLHLDQGKQLGGVLDLVDQDRGREALEKQGRLRLGKAPEQGVVQRDVGAIPPLKCRSKVVFPTCRAPVTRRTGNWREAWRRNGSRVL